VAKTSSTRSVNETASKRIVFCAFIPVNLSQATKTSIIVA
jgi:hypothetical protein